MTYAFCVFAGMVFMHGIFIIRALDRIADALERKP
jgi:hypothetical protein